MNRELFLAFAVSVFLVNPIGRVATCPISASTVAGLAHCIAYGMKFVWVYCQPELVVTSSGLAARVTNL